MSDTLLALMPNPRMLCHDTESFGLWYNGGLGPQNNFMCACLLVHLGTPLQVLTWTLASPA